MIIFADGMYLIHIIKCSAEDFPRNIPQRRSFWQNMINAMLPGRLYCRRTDAGTRDENTIVVMEFPHERSDAFILSHVCSKILTSFPYVYFSIIETKSENF
jgi:hypothetical protein